MPWLLMILLFIPACGQETTGNQRQPSLLESQSSADATAESASSKESAGSHDIASDEGQPSSDIDSTQTRGPAAGIDPWQAWAPLCKGYPSKADCDVGDATLFSGLLCTSGVELGCEAVRLAQDQNGRFWRSPRLVGVSTQNSFSRDMALGVLHWLLKKKDKAAATAWIQWIDQHSICQIPAGSNCLLRTYRFCTDDTDSRCTITPGLWANMKRVWDQLGLPLHSQMKTAGEGLFETEARSVKLGYELHLKAVMAYLYQQTGQNLAVEQSVTNILFERQPENPFFRFLKEGASPELQEQLRNLCPQQPTDLQNQWAWERDTAEQAWQQSMGWDCVFLGRLLL